MWVVRWVVRWVVEVLHTYTHTYTCSPHSSSTGGWTPSPTHTPPHAWHHHQPSTPYTHTRPHAHTPTQHPHSTRPHATAPVDRVHGNAHVLVAAPRVHLLLLPLQVEAVLACGLHRVLGRFGRRLCFVCVDGCVCERESRSAAGRKERKRKTHVRSCHPTDGFLPTNIYTCTYTCMPGSPSASRPHVL